MNNPFKSKHLTSTTPFKKNQVTYQQLDTFTIS